MKSKLLFSVCTGALAIGFLAAAGSVAITMKPAFAQSGHSGGAGSHSDSSDHSHDDETHDDTSHSSGSKGKGRDGSGGQSDGGHDDDGHDDASHGSGGQGGPGADSEGRGPKYGQQTDKTRSRPPWAKEGIPEVELGRLNVARSPDRVLDRAYMEALSNFTIDKVDFYNMSIEEAAAALRTDFDNVSMLDSPLQNLSLLRDILQDGNSVLNTLDQVQNDNQTLAAIFLGTASDKSIEILPETAYALSVILGYTLTEEQANDLANDAEIIRAAIAEGHG
jgi:hypothetical protein